MSANVDNMMYVNETPWHGLGTKLDKPATAAEAIAAAQLDWEVKTFPVAAKLGAKHYLTVPKLNATVRMDTQTALGVVGRLYTPVQNKEAFNFFDSVVGENKAIYHVAGSLGIGQTIWILAKLPDDIRIVGTDDIINKYLLLTNTHDGSMSLRMFFTPIRVVCQNTLSAAMSSRRSGEGISIRHFPDVMKKVDQAKQALGLAIDFYKDVSEAYNALAGVQINQEWLKDYIDFMFPPAEGQEPSTRLINIRENVVACFESTSNMLPGIKGTAWAAYNAVTEYVDHHRRIPKLDKDPTNKLSSIWLGSGAVLKQAALKAALERADIGAEHSERLFASVGVL